MSDRYFVIITPARNEEGYLEETIKSVIAQSVLPEKWVIVDDGSTDNTGAIAKKYAEKFGFIEVVDSSNDPDRNFGSKVAAFNAGYKKMSGLSYAYIGNLDADVTFETDYFERLLDKFKDNEKLGLAGGIIAESIGGKFVEQSISSNSVAGAVQLFRRTCFEEIGGYIPLKYGGIDAAAEIISRMYGWEVQTMQDLIVHHHRRVAKAGTNILKARFRQGKMFYLLGYHPVFYLFSSLSKVFDKPYFFGSLFRMFGFIWSGILRLKRPLSDDVITYLRSEQKERLKQKFVLGNSTGV